MSGGPSGPPDAVSGKLSEHSGSVDRTPGGRGGTYRLSLPAAVFAIAGSDLEVCELRGFFVNLGDCEAGAQIRKEADLAPSI